MTNLALRVVKHTPGTYIRLGAVAEIIPKGASRGKPAPAHLRSLVLPIGDAVSPLIVAVEPGEHIVRATLPSGEVLITEIEVKPGDKTMNIDLVAESLIHTDRRAPSRQTFESIQTARGAAMRSRHSDLYSLWFEAATSKERFNDWLTSDSTVNGQAIRLLFGTLKKTGQLKGVFADDDYGTFEIAGIPSTGSNETSKPSLKALLGTNNLSGQSRHYLALEDKRGICALAVLPLPWLYSNQSDPRAGQEMAIQIKLRKPVPGSCFAENTVQPYISVDDPDVGALLEFLGKSDLQSAESILSQAAHWLYGKVMNPFAAAAGGYILLAAEGLRAVKSDEWKGWIENLATWFEWLPDGSIQLAWLKLNSISPDVEAGCDKEKKIDAVVAEARELLLRALGAGVPLYSYGVRLLVDSLTLVASHEESRERNKTVQGAATTRALMLARWLSRRTDPSQPFTAIRM